MAEAGFSTDVGDFYEDYWSRGGFAPDRPLAAPVATVLSQWTRSTDACIDVGCGGGEGVGEWLNSRARSYLGVDISKAAVDASRKRGLDAVQVSDASDLPCESSSFDLAVCFEVLEHHFSPHLVAAEVLRVLRPGGRFLVTVPNVAHWRRRADLALLGRWNPLGDEQSVRRPWRDPHVRFFGMATLRRMLEDTGFLNVRVDGLSGAFLVHVPGFRRFVRHRDTPSALHRRLVDAYPGMFGYLLFASAMKPGADLGG